MELLRKEQGKVDAELLFLKRGEEISSQVTTKQKKREENIVKLVGKYKNSEMWEFMERIVMNLSHD